MLMDSNLNVTQRLIVTKALIDAAKISQEIDSDYEFEYPEVEFGSLGQYAGLAFCELNKILLDRISNKAYHILNDTIRHELAHILQYLHYPESLDHGKEWRNIAVKMGAIPNSKGSL